MTDPNSASSQPEEVNSAPSLLQLKLIQLSAMAWFWMMVVAVSLPLSDFIYGVPVVVNSNSALFYLAVSLTYLLWTTLTPFKYFMPEWAAIVPVLGLASVLVLKYDSPLFIASTHAVWLFTANAYARGHVFPWSPYVRLCFVSDRLIYAAAAEARARTEQDPKPEESPNKS